VQLQRTAIAGEAHAYLVASTDRYSAADLEALVRKARLRTRNAGRQEIGLEEARQAVATLRPNSISKAEWYEKITIAACNDTDLLPPGLAQLLDDRSALDDVIATIQPDGGSRRGIRL
jgi:SpoVK/Ycf46/Vps4 family AAA+-type ATPase